MPVCSLECRSVREDLADAGWKEDGKEADVNQTEDLESYFRRDLDLPGVPRQDPEHGPARICHGLRPVRPQRADWSAASGQQERSERGQTLE